MTVAFRLRPIVVLHCSIVLITASRSTGTSLGEMRRHLKVVVCVGMGLTIVRAQRRLQTTLYHGANLDRMSQATREYLS